MFIQAKIKNEEIDKETQNVSKWEIPKKFCSDLTTNQDKTIIP